MKNVPVPSHKLYLEVLTKASYIVKNILLNEFTFATYQILYCLSLIYNFP